MAKTEEIAKDLAKFKKCMVKFIKCVDAIFSSAAAVVVHPSFAVVASRTRLVLQHIANKDMETIKDKLDTVPQAEKDTMEIK